MKMSDLIIPGLAVAAMLLLSKSSHAEAPADPAPGAGGVIPCPPRAGGGVFELNVPEGSYWKISGPYGYFGPSGTREGAAWTPIQGTQACIESDQCVVADIFLRGPDGTERSYHADTAYPDCVKVINW